MKINVFVVGLLSLGFGKTNIIEYGDWWEKDV